MAHRFQTALNVLFPPRCLGCGGLVEADFGLCGACWRETPFITGLVCDACGVPLPGSDEMPDVLCDDCIETPRPWISGRSALMYKDRARKIVLALKHGHRTEIAAPAAAWMHQAARHILSHRMLIVPVPLHWTRLFHRTFNQSAVLAKALADRTEIKMCPDLLLRSKRTASLDKKTVGERFATLERAIVVNPRQQHRIAERPILLVDDVMTSGATLTAATRACLAAGSGDVFVLTLARVAKDT